MTKYHFFIRSIRVRYISGLLIVAAAAGAILYTLTRMNAFEQDLDRLGNSVVSFSRDLRNASSFAEQTVSSWRAESRAELSSAARDHAERLDTGITRLDADIAAMRARLSENTLTELDGAAINGDLFWSARDMARNLGVLAAAPTWDEWGARAVKNQNELFAQPMLLRAPRAIFDSLNPTCASGCFLVCLHASCIAA